MLKSAIASIAAFAAFSASVVDAGACDDLRPGPVGKVVQVTDGDTIVLDSGIVVRMIGTQAPKLPLGRAGFETWPKAQDAKEALEKLALDHQVRLKYGGEQVDRYDRALAQVFVVTEGGEIWAQEAMVEQGMARVYSFADNRKCLDQLYAAEGRARTARLGIWSDPYYSIRLADHPDRILDRVGHYELVEGRVLLADEAGGRVYLNFGRRWKEDFTAVIEAPAQKLFAALDRDPLQLEGALVRIRGWVDERDGPRIEITHPEQIEVLATP
ncbi:thermonuclease family protein [Devosia algicola]|uniref:Thermonuclease family protein n=1 Tax=Devosia algicola TaxID=3026418 RepID=A0ABY7YJR3_9HYPH|nr:thermonuclease family protein [Devosia algicola]WDR01422.1 thermonuclease family protein [Devosia algicola]